jgi:hypothetical protein
MADFVALKVKEANQDRLLDTPNIIGTGVGKKEIDGKVVSSIMVFVEKKLSEDDIIKKYSAAEVIPSNIDGVPTSVIEVGKITKQGFQSKVRPIQPGYSIGHAQITAGTLGGLFKDKDGEIVALTNNHVGAWENKAAIGDPIYQPGPMDAPRGSIAFTNWSQPANTLPYFGTLKRFIPLNRANNLHDSAIIKVHKSFIDSNLISTQYPQINKQMNSTNTAAIGMRVQKCGRTTGYTTGSVMALHGSFTIAYDFGSARFNDCVVFSGMSAGGDSGSLIFDENMNAVALLFAGSDKVTLGNPIHYPVNEYGLVPYNSAIRSSAAEDGTEWALKSVNGVIQATNSTLQVNSKAFVSCYVEKKVEKFSSISVKVKPLSDLSKTYGPGIAVSAGNSFLKLNLEASGVQGTSADTSSFAPMPISGDVEYMMRFKRVGDNVTASFFTGSAWVDIINGDLPANQPIMLKVGKLNVRATDGGEIIEGDLVSSFFSDVKIS